jgi:hypothetical protein
VPRDDGRAAQYKFERETVFIGANGEHAISVMQDVLRKMPRALMLRTVFGHPVVMLATFSYGLVVGIKAIFHRVPAADGSEPVPSTDAQLSAAVRSDWSDQKGAMSFRGIRDAVRNFISNLDTIGTVGNTV